MLLKVWLDGPLHQNYHGDLLNMYLPAPLLKLLIQNCWTVGHGIYILTRPPVIFGLLTFKNWITETYFLCLIKLKKKHHLLSSPMGLKMVGSLYEVGLFYTFQLKN